LIAEKPNANWGTYRKEGAGPPEKQKSMLLSGYMVPQNEFLVQNSQLERKRKHLDKGEGAKWLANRALRPGGKIRSEFNEISHWGAKKEKAEKTH